MNPNTQEILKDIEAITTYRQLQEYAERLLVLDTDTPDFKIIGRAYAAKRRQVKPTILDDGYTTTKE